MIEGKKWKYIDTAERVLIESSRAFYLLGTGAISVRAMTYREQQ